MLLYLGVKVLPAQATAAGHQLGQESVLLWQQPAARIALGICTHVCCRVVQNARVRCGRTRGIYVIALQGPTGPRI